jgi:hypothetical protein
LEDFERVFDNNLALVLDRLGVRRLRKVMGKDRYPLNEVELIRDSLTNNYRIMRGNNGIRVVPGQSVGKIKICEKIHLSTGEFKRQAVGFFVELERKFLIYGPHSHREKSGGDPLSRATDYSQRVK